MKKRLLIAIPMLSLILATLACIPQDCMGSTVSVKGQVVDNIGGPVSGATIRAYGGRCYEVKGFDFTVASDENGYFETENAFRYACCDFKVEVSAEGYTTQTFKFYPRGEQWPDELPEELTVTLEAD